MLVFLAFKKKVVIICGVWQRSSVVEQRNHNPLVGGPNPSAATKIQTGFIPVLILVCIITWGGVVGPRDDKEQKNTATGAVG